MSVTIRSRTDRITTTTVNVRPYLTANVLDGTWKFADTFRVWNACLSKTWIRCRYSCFLFSSKTICLKENVCIIDDSQYR